MKKLEPVNMHKPAQTLVQAREYVFDKFVNAGFTTDMSIEFELSILTYTKTKCKQMNLKALIWSNVQLRRIYIRKMRTILYNVAPILKLVNSGEVLVNEIVSLDHQTLRPELWDPIIERIKKRAMNTMIADNENRFDGLLQCQVCSGWKTRYIEFQTRGADEPLTVFARCLDCNINWRF